MRHLWARSYFSVNICSSSIEATGVLIRATHPALGQNSQADVIIFGHVHNGVKLYDVIYDEDA